MFQLLKFISLNFVLPISDVATDFSTFLTQEDNGQVWWGYLTLGWMFMPVLIRLMTFIYNFPSTIRKLTRKLSDNDSDNTSDSDSERVCHGTSEVISNVVLLFFKKVLLHLPFCLPLHNLYLAYKLLKLSYGMPAFVASNSAKVEVILSEVAECSFLESYFEAGGQATLQLIIILSTGQASTSQQISIVLSLLSLAWGASRGYFHQRSPDAADPDPALGMVVMRVFFLMLVVVLNSLALWVFIGGLLGPWTFPALLINSVIIFFSLKVTPTHSSKRRRRRRRSAGEGTIRMRMTAIRIQTVTERPWPESDTVESEKGDDFFVLKASTFSVWLPSVVGNITDFPKMFLISSIASLAAKVVTLATAVSLALAGFQDHIQKNHFLILCRENTTLNQGNSENNIVYCDSWKDCFNSTDNLQQKIRICGDSETSFRLYLLLALVVSTLLALLATHKLNRISDYEKLFQDSKYFLFIFPTQPVVHRKLLLDTVEQDNKELLEDILKSHIKKTAYGYMVAWLKTICRQEEDPVNSEDVKADYVDRANPTIVSYYNIMLLAIPLVL